MKIKILFATITALLITALLIRSNNLFLNINNSEGRKAQSNSRDHKRFEIINNSKLQEVKELIVTPVIADSGKSDIYVMKSGFSMINDLANGKYTNRYSLCIPDYSIDYVNKNTGDTLNIGQIDCTDEDHDVFIDGNYRFEISKDVMKYVKNNSSKIKLSNKEFKSKKEAREWYAGNKDKIKIYNHYEIGYDMLIGFVALKDTSKIVDIGCTLNRHYKGDLTRKRFVCDDFFEQKLKRIDVDYKKYERPQEIWYKKII